MKQRKSAESSQWQSLSHHSVKYHRALSSVSMQYLRAANASVSVWARPRHLVMKNVIKYRWVRCSAKGYKWHKIPKQTKQNLKGMLSLSKGQYFILTEHQTVWGWILHIFQGHFNNSKAALLITVPDCSGPYGQTFGFPTECCELVAKVIEKG